MSATLVSLYRGLLCFPMLTYFSEAQIFHAAVENGQLLQYGHAYHAKMMETRMCALRNSCTSVDYTITEFTGKIDYWFTCNRVVCCCNS